MTDPIILLVVMIGSAALGVALHEVAHTLPDRWYGVPFSYVWYEEEGRLSRYGLTIPLVNASPAVRYDVSIFRVTRRVVRYSALAPLLVGGSALLVSALLPVDAPPVVILSLLLFFATGLPSGTDLMMVWWSRKRFVLRERAAYYRGHRHHRAAEGIEAPALRLPG